MTYLFVISAPPHPPRWAAYLKSHVSVGLGGLLTAFASAVLLLEAAGRLFAITFGQGKVLLHAESFEHDFGLRVVLKTVAPDQLMSVDARTIEETTLRTRRDVSRDSSFSAFGLDIRRDLLRAVTGTPQDATLAQRLTGADALGRRARRCPSFQRLPSACCTRMKARSTTRTSGSSTIRDRRRIRPGSAG